MEEIKADDNTRLLGYWQKAHREVVEAATETQARALAAETRLLAIRTAHDDFGRCGDCYDYRVAVGVAIPLYPDLAAARELMAKAEERDALAAHVEQAKFAIAEMKEIWNAWPPKTESLPHDLHIGKIFELGAAILALTPTASLAAYRAGVLEEVAQNFEYPKLCLPLPKADDTFFSYADVVAGSIVEQIRAMKEAK